MHTLAPGVASSDAHQTEMSDLEESNAVDCRARVLAVDDDPPFLNLLCDLVRASSELVMVGEAESGERAVDAAHELRPDIVLMDVRMPGLGGIEAARRIKASHPGSLVVLISTSHPVELPYAVEDSGAEALIWKCELQPKLLDELWLRWRG